MRVPFLFLLALAVLRVLTQALLAGVSCCKQALAAGTVLRPSAETQLYEEERLKVAQAVMFCWSPAHLRLRLRELLRSVPHPRVLRESAVMWWCPLASVRQAPAAKSRWRRVHRRTVQVAISRWLLVTVTWMMAATFDCWPAEPLPPRPGAAVCKSRAARAHHLTSVEVALVGRFPSRVARRVGRHQTLIMEVT
jgi:hypothetical protein